MKIIVLGAGLVGGPMAADLAADPLFEVTAVDANAEALARLAKIRGIRTLRADLSRPEDVRGLVAGFDLVLSAVPGFMGFRTLQAVLEADKNVVDIAFFPEDPFALDGLARAQGVTALVDCGVAPGMSNVLTGYSRHRLDEVLSVLIYVGGLPEVREWPYEYKAVFSPVDVIEEYIRPARYVQNGALVVRPALSDPELINFPGLGTLEAFNTDGLRTLIGTIAAPDMKEKTLRYPGHIEKMAVLRETGFFSQDEIEVGGVRIRPLDVTAKLLFPKWKMGPGDRDVTVMKIVVEGKKDGRSRRFTYDLLDRFDEAKGVHSMARTTGYTATVAARMLARGLFAEKGVFAPESVGRRPDCVAFLLAGLKERRIVYHETIE
ncbi:MAG: saccharopine dehydrogenase C-terminal domain-containing protein [Candidatus Aminicenantales bacterium]|jgi:saccharopine dehydrogenase-like NADP-dependent oxidoreductase